jgi:hypothetical protein
VSRCVTMPSHDPMPHAAILSRRHPLQISPPQFRGSRQLVGSLVSYKSSCYKSLSTYKFSRTVTQNLSLTLTDVPDTPMSGKHAAPKTFRPFRPFRSVRFGVVFVGRRFAEKGGWSATHSLRFGNGRHIVPTR